jgi:hypothetical protein
VIARPDKVAALATLLLCSPLQAKAYQIAGIGLQSCGSWTAARGGGMAALEVQWVLGYVSGVGFAGQILSNEHSAYAVIDPLDGTDAQAVLAWIDNYCRAKPLDQIEQAAGAFVFAHPVFDASGGAVSTSLMKDDEHKWVDVDRTNDTSPSPSDETQRMRVPGGWIYKHKPKNGGSWAIVFVPEPAGNT